MANRLQFETSAYLLQHANNPVDWYPWSEDAFKRAQKENKPIFLSIGYSTCHWCHVMEKESFEDVEVAEFLNNNFISIKVDREERPDIDSIYMNVCQMITGSGGWPLSIFMDSKKRPFFAGTYFPKHDVYGMIGFISLLKITIQSWKNNKKNLIEFSNNIINNLKRPAISKDISEDIIDKTYQHLELSFDNQFGGFGNAPKFPTPHTLLFLLRYWFKTKDSFVLEMVRKTLDSMYNGGIYDHVGFGFSRYSTDNRWLVPHFEKMLYDNALLSIVYLEFYQITNEDKYKNIIKDIFTFIKREMMDKKGGFYSAIDADSEGIEGKYYVWDKTEIIEILGEETGNEFCEYYNISENGNFEGRNILNRIGKNFEDNKFKAFIEKLYNHRKKRIPPFKDNKMLTSWNGLVIVALAMAGRILDDIEYIEMAKRSVSFIFDNMLTKEKELYAVYSDGKSKVLGFAEDYSFMIWALIEMYEATFEEEYLEKAVYLNNHFIEQFWDEEEGGFFLYGKKSEKLITRPKEIYDGAIPSTNSIAIYNMIRLSKLTEDYSLDEKANLIFNSFSSIIEDNPISCTFCLMSMIYKNNSKHIVLVGEDLSKMMHKVNMQYNPFTTVLVYTEKIKELFPHIQRYNLLNNKNTAYICEGFKCNPPINFI